MIEENDQTNADVQMQNNHSNINTLRVVMGTGPHIVERILDSITSVTFVGILTLEINLSNRPELGLIQETAEFYCQVYLPPENPLPPGLFAPSYPLPDPDESADNNPSN